MLSCDIPVPIHRKKGEPGKQEKKRWLYFSYHQELWAGLKSTFNGASVMSCQCVAADRSETHHTENTQGQPAPVTWREQLAQLTGWGARAAAEDWDC